VFEVPVSGGSLVRRISPLAVVARAPAERSGSTGKGGTGSQHLDSVPIRVRRSSEREASNERFPDERRFKFEARALEFFRILRHLRTRLVVLEDERRNFA
jgi:hypothetical protein